MVPHFTGRRVDWDDARGHGWIETDGQRIFLHRREFAEFRKALDSLAHSLTLTGYVYVAPSPRPSFPATPLPVRPLDELTSRSFTLAGKGLLRGYIARGVQPQQRNRAEDSRRYNNPSNQPCGRRRDSALITDTSATPLICQKVSARG